MAPCPEPTWGTPWAGLDLTLRWRYIGPSDVDRSSSNPQLTQPYYPYTAHIPALQLHRLLGGDADWPSFVVRVGVNNIADKNPPLILNGNLLGLPEHDCNDNTWVGTYDTLGRYLYVQPDREVLIEAFRFDESIDGGLRPAVFFACALGRPRSATWHHARMARDLKADQELLGKVLALAQNRNIRAGRRAGRTGPGGGLRASAAAQRRWRRASRRKASSPEARPPARARRHAGAGGRRRCATPSPSSCSAWSGPPEALAHVEVILSAAPAAGLCAREQGQRADLTGRAGPGAGQPPAGAGTGPGQPGGHGLAGLDRHPPRRTRQARGAGPSVCWPACRGSRTPCSALPPPTSPAARPARADGALRELLADRRAGPKDRAGHWACWATCWTPRGATRKPSRPTAPAMNSLRSSIAASRERARLPTLAR